MPPSAPSPFPSFPLTGRDAELELIRSLLDQADAGRGGMLILCGDTGVGKSRLLQLAMADAARRGWTAAMGRAYPVETGIPYAPFADALLPVLRALSPEALAGLTRGAEADLAYLFPMLRLPEGAAGRVPDNPAEYRVRLLWNFAQFLGRLASRQPLLLVLDDLQWTDASSLELLHFVARQVGGERVALLAAYNDALREQNPQLRAMEQSLTALDAARVHRVRALSHADTGALIGEAFGAEEAVTREFTALLYGWTRGNPFFLEEILKALIHSGRLHQREGIWLGWELEEIDLPRSVREAVLDRLASLSPSARAVADLLAVIGTSVSHEALRSLAGVEETELIAAVDELRRDRVVEERLDTERVVYDFPHPVLRETLYGELGLARAKLLHARVARALEAHHGDAAPQHADELAYHYARTHARDLAPKAVQYLSAAGRSALQKYSNREAADYLSTALDRASEAGAAETEASLLEDLARARQRLGEFDAATALWERAREQAEAAGDAARVASAERRLGLACYWRGRYPEALDHFAAGLEWVERAGDERLRARLRLSEAECLLEMGRPADARERIEAALATAERLDEPVLLARVHLALLLVHTWIGPPEEARSHGARALELAERMQDTSLCCTVHWGLGMLSGLTGDPVATPHHISTCARLAEELQSPLHRLRAAELAIEYMANTGEWDAGLALGERTIASARALNQRAPLARLLVWTALIHLGRGDLERGRRYVDEAWGLAGAEGGEGGSFDVHAVVPAHCGRTAYHVAAGEWEEAIRVGQAGLAIADRTGYTVWAIHRLLPFMAEAHLSAGDLKGATRLGARLRRDAERLGHRLGLAWADACDAFLVWMRGDADAGLARLRAAAERLEAIDVVPDAARIRRHVAWRLRDIGDREAALRELRHVHDVFVRLGAEPELAKTRDVIRELGARPPVKEAGTGVGGLSAREVEIARLVATRKSNKAIAKLLDISPRTVGTHLSNIFRKLEVDSRAELADRIRHLELSNR